MNRAKPRSWWMLRFSKSDLRLGPKVWVGLLLVGAILWLGIWATPTNGWAGAGIGLAGVLGAVLGLLFQPTPRERDFTGNGASAVRGLLGVAEDVENAQVLITQLSQVATKNARLTVGLVDAQDRLRSVRVELYSSMAEWDAVAPGSLSEVSRLREDGKRAFEMLAKKGEIDV